MRDVIAIKDGVGVHLYIEGSPRSNPEFTGFSALFFTDTSPPGPYPRKVTFSEVRMRVKSKILNSFKLSEDFRVILLGRLCCHKWYTQRCLAGSRGFRSSPSTSVRPARAQLRSRVSFVLQTQCPKNISRNSSEVIDSRDFAARAARAWWLPSRNGGALAVYRGGLATLSSAEG